VRDRAALVAGSSFHGEGNYVLFLGTYEHFLSHGLDNLGLESAALIVTFICIFVISLRKPQETYRGFGMIRFTCTTFVSKYRYCSLDMRLAVSYIYIYI